MDYKHGTMRFLEHEHSLSMTELLKEFLSYNKMENILDLRHL